MPLRSPSESDLESYKSEQPLLSPGKSNPAEKSSSAGHRPPTAAFPDEPLRPKAGAAAMGVAALLVAGYLLLGKRHVSSSWHTSHVFPRVGGVTGTSYQREGGHDPGGFALCRQLIGALLMAALGYCREGSSIFALRRSDHRAIAKLGAPSARSACRRAATREAARACTGPWPAPRCRRVPLPQLRALHLGLQALHPLLRLCGAAKPPPPASALPSSSSASSASSLLLPPPPSSALHPLLRLRGAALPSPTRQETRP